MPWCLVHDRVEVGIRKSVLLDAREEPEEGRRGCDVGGLHIAGTADAAMAVGNDRARIAGGREGTQLVGEDSPLRRGLVSAAAKIFANV